MIPPAGLRECSLVDFLVLVTPQSLWECTTQVSLIIIYICVCLYIQVHTHKYIYIWACISLHTGMFVL